MQTTRRLLPVLSLVLLGAAGCGRPVTEEGAGNAAKTAPTGAAAPANDKPMKIAAILMQDDQFFRLNELGMRDAAKKHNVELLTGTAAGSLDKEISLVDTYGGQGVDAILVSPLNPKGSAAALKSASGKGVKIVTYNNSLEQDFVAGGLKSDDVALGASTGTVAREYIQKKLGGKANIAVLQYVALLPDNGKLRPQGFAAEMKKVPGAKIVATQDAWLAPEAERVATDILNAHPEVNVFWCANEGATVGATTAVRNANKAGKVVVFGTDISEQLASFLLSGDNILQAVTGQKPYEMGFGGVEAAVKAAGGGKVEKLKIVPGQLYTRDNPAPIKAFQEQVRKLS